MWNADKVFRNSRSIFSNSLYVLLFIAVGCQMYEKPEEKPKMNNLCSYSYQNYLDTTVDIEEQFFGLSFQEALVLMNSLGLKEQKRIALPTSNGKYLYGGYKVCDRQGGNTDTWQVELLFDRFNIVQDAGFYLFFHGKSFADRNVPLRSSNIMAEDDLFDAVYSLSKTTMPTWSELKKHLLDGGFTVRDYIIRREADFSQLSVKTLGMREAQQISVDVGLDGKVKKVKKN